ncbi:PilZ domain-containing protein [Aliidiomarina sp. Khilg15.8]
MTNEHAATELLQDYKEYYAIKEQIQINVHPQPSEFTLPSPEDFKQQVPEIFKLASEMQAVDTQALASLRSLGDSASIIANILNQQNRKLNALLAYLLSHEDAEEDRHHTFEYGGAGVGYLADAPLPVESLVELKIFLPAESAAIYSYAQVVECQPEADQHRIRLLFVRISDDDREVIVRASLHAQSRLLKKRAAERDNAPSTE